MQRDIEARERQSYPYVKTFVDRFHQLTGDWPTPPAIPDPAKVSDLRSVLAERGIDISEERLKELIIRSQLGRARRQFEARFTALNPRLPQSPSADHLATTYVDTFAENRKYVWALVDFAWLRGCECTRGQLESCIDAAISRRALQRRTEAMRQALFGDETLVPEKSALPIPGAMTGRQFEFLLERIFAAKGYDVEVTKASGDQGADLIIEKFGERTAVQAKRQSQPVSNGAIQEVVAAKAFYRCEKAMVVTDSSFTKSAKELARSNDVKLWDGPKLNEMMEKYLT